MRKTLADGNNLLYAWFEAMNTRVDALFYAAIPHHDLEQIATAIQDKIRKIEAIANRFNPKSELYQLNKQAFAQPFPISKELAEMINECLVFHKKTFGCFDITVNSHNNFRYGADNILLDVEKKTVQLRHRDVQVDLNGYVKGYALRAAVQMLRENAIRNALINMGNSSIQAIGNHPNGEGWSVGLDPAFNKSVATVTLHDECLTTSGNGTGKPRHIINPATGELVGEAATVSVVTSDAALGEILSTALFVADASQQKSMLEQLPVKLVGECQRPFAT